MFDAGIGDGTVNGREKAVVAYLEDHVAPTLIGKDPMRTEDIWQYLYKGAYWRRGPITMAAIAAIDMALWDIKAKAANMPLYQLLGGRSRDKVMVYKHVGGLEIPEVVDGVLALREQGLDAIRAQPQPGRHQHGRQHQFLAKGIFVARGGRKAGERIAGGVDQALQARLAFVGTLQDVTDRLQHG